VAAVVLSLAVGHAMLYSVQASLIPELFGTRLRYTGASLGYQLARAIAGGSAPLIAAWLAPHLPGAVLAAGGVFAGSAPVSMVCVLFLAETSAQRL